MGNWISKPAKTNSFSGAQSGNIDTQIFFVPTHPPVGQKMSLVNFKHKIATSANYTDSIGTGYKSHDKELCLKELWLKNHLKINQSN